MSVWERRDRPVLQYLANYPPAHGVLFTQRWNDAPRADVPQLTEAEVHRAVETLKDAGYVVDEGGEGEGGGGSAWFGLQVTGAGKQQLGLWPRFDALGSPGELAQVLEALAEEAAIDEERSNLRRAAEVVRRRGPEAVRSVLAGALGAYARAHLGL